MKPTLLILAAGMGSRYGGLKQLDAVGPAGETIMDYSVFDALRAGFGKVVYVIRKDFEQAFRDQIASKWANVTHVDFAFQEFDRFVPEDMRGRISRKKPWGTAHAILVADEVVAEPFAVINADDYYGKSSFDKMASFLENECSERHYAMVGYRLANTLSENGAVSRGICQMNSRGHLIKVSECTGIQRSNGLITGTDENGNAVTLQPDDLVSMNLWGFHPYIFELLKKGFDEFLRTNVDNPSAEFYISTYANQLIQSHQITFSVIPSDASWYGVTYQADKPIVQKAFEEMISAGLYPTPLWESL